MKTSTTTYWNDRHKKIRRQLIKKFGAKCRYCGTPDEDFSNSPLAKKLHFCHKVNKRISGSNRGRNFRILDIVNNPDNYWLGCCSCHRKYDYDHPLTEVELTAQQDEYYFMRKMWSYD